MSVCVVLNTPYHFETLYCILSILKRIGKRPIVWSHPTFLTLFGLKDILASADVPTTSSLQVFDDEAHFIVISSALMKYSLPVDVPEEVLQVHKILQIKHCIYICHNLKPYRWKPVPHTRMFLTPLAHARYGHAHLHQIEGIVTPKVSLNNCIVVIGRLTYSHVSVDQAMWSAVRRGAVASGKRICILGIAGNEQSGTALAAILGILRDSAEAHLNLSEGAFYEQIGSCCAVLALGAPNDPPTCPYFQYKMSSSYGMAIQFRKPLIAYPLVRHLHGIPVLPYRDADELQFVIENIDAMSAGYLKAMEPSREHMLRHNAMTLVEALIQAPPPNKPLELNVHYNAPLRRDVAVLIAHFNFCEYERPVRNLVHVLTLLQASGVPTFIGHGKFPEQASLDLPYGTVHEFFTRTPFFAKERLLNLVEARVPREFTKLVFLDGDIVFQNKDWINSLSLALDTFHVVQGYARSGSLSHSLDSLEKGHWEASAAALVADRELHALYAHSMVGMGFCWAMRRDFFSALGGLYDKCITGGGDRVVFASAFGRTRPLERLQITDAYFPCAQQREEIEAYLAAAASLQPAGGHLPDDVLHLWHGSAKHRQYSARHEELEKCAELPIRTNLTGLYEITDEAVGNGLVTYFQNRQEDSVDDSIILA